MTKFNFSKALLTMGLSMFLSLTGFVVCKSAPTMGIIGLFFVFPFLFGISIPLANWADVGVMKIPKVVFAGLLSAGLLYIAIIFSASEFNMYLVSGLNSAVLLWVYSKLVKTVQPTPIHYLIVFILCLTAIGLSLRSPDSRGVPDLYFTVLLWTSFFTIGLTTSLGTKSTAANN